MSQYRFQGAWLAACPSCRARANEWCRTLKGKRVGRPVSYPHAARVEAWWKRADIKVLS